MCVNFKRAISHSSTQTSLITSVVLGILQDDKFCADMCKVSPGQINFTAFLTFMGEKLQDTDPEDVLHNAFACFDVHNTGAINQKT